MKKSVLLLTGFVLFILGMLALVLSIIGANFVFLKWIDFAGKSFGFVLRLVMIIAGIVIAYSAVSNFSGEDPPSVPNASN